MADTIDFDRIVAFVNFLGISQSLNAEELDLFQTDLILLVQRKFVVLNLVDIIVYGLNKIIFIKSLIDEKLQICPCYEYIDQRDIDCLLFRSVDNSYLSISTENLSVWITDSQDDFQKLKQLF